MASFPQAGSLDATPLPWLLLELFRARYRGGLSLRNGRVEKSVLLHDGEPVRVTSSRSAESLTRLLQSRGTLSEEDAERVTETVSQRSMPEEAVLVALKLVGPKDLVLALREAARERLLECFAWSAGEFRCEGEAPAEGSQVFRLDPVVLVRDGLAAHWPADRLLGDLSEKLERYPVRDESYERWAPRLAQGEGVAALLEALTPEQVVWTALQANRQAPAVASLWVLDTLGALRFAREAPGSETPEEKPEPPAAPEPEIEIVIEGSGGGEAPAKAGARPAAKKAAPAKNDKTEALRKEVLEKHAQLQELDYYTLLGVAPKDGAAQVKRAYLMAAKRYHPDALTRVGLGEIKDQANEVFARIAKAHEVLSDPEAREQYDAELGGADEVDAERVAQAEMLYRKGEILLRAGNFNGAAEFFLGAVQVWPDEPEYQSDLGWVLYKKNPPELERAREHLEQAVAGQPEVATHHHRLSLVLRELGEAEAAGTALAQARKLDPSIKG